jgi:hypothetical protein
MNGFGAGMAGVAGGKKRTPRGRKLRRRPPDRKWGPHRQACSHWVRLATAGRTHVHAEDGTE